MNQTAASPGGGEMQLVDRKV